MKKIALLLSLIYGLSLSLSAQEDFRFGVQVSPSFSWLASNDNQINGNGTNLGLHLGFTGEYYFAERYAFLAGLGFAFNQGGTFEHKIGGNFWTKSELSNPDLNALPDGVNLKYNLQYVEIPFGLKMRTNEFGYFRYYAELPIFTLGIRTQARGDITSAAELNTEREDIKQDVNLLNLSWGLGAGAEYNINSNTAIVLGIQYAQGFLDITDDAATKKDGTSEDSNGTTRSITIRLGVMF